MSSFHPNQHFLSIATPFHSVFPRVIQVLVMFKQLIALTFVTVALAGPTTVAAPGIITARQSTIGATCEVGEFGAFCSGNLPGGGPFTFDVRGSWLPLRCLQNTDCCSLHSLGARRSALEDFANAMVALLMVAIPARTLESNGTDDSSWMLATARWRGNPREELRSYT